MATNYTQNYKLNLWEPDDQVRRVDFNADNQKIDAALAALNTTVAGHTGTLSQKGNCQIATGTYVGDGKYGASSPTTITFPFQPKLVIVQCVDGATTDYAVSSKVGLSMFILLRPLKSYWLFQGHSRTDIIWSGNKVSFYSEFYPGQQANEEGKTYLYAAFG